MTRYALLVPLAFLFVGCGKAGEGEDCSEDADCDDEENLVCVFATDATADEDGTCEVDDAMTTPE